MEKITEAVNAYLIKNSRGEGKKNRKRKKEIKKTQRLCEERNISSIYRSFLFLCFFQWEKSALVSFIKRKTSALTDVFIKRKSQHYTVAEVDSRY